MSSFLGSQPLSHTRSLNAFSSWAKVTGQVAVSAQAGAEQSSSSAASGKMMFVRI